MKISTLYYKRVPCYLALKFRDIWHWLYHVSNEHEDNLGCVVTGYGDSANISRIVTCGYDIRRVYKNRLFNYDVFPFVIFSTFCCSHPR
jgi:hypothetical protein